jgi:hypothetical protein
MRMQPLAGLVLVSASRVAGADFVALPPHPIAGFATYEVFQGELASSRLKAGYRFYVDPARAALFTVMRYRLRATGGESMPTEKFVWNERPGQGVALRCFEWIESAEGSAWRELAAGGVDYQREMSTLRLVLSEQNHAYRRQVEEESGR